jgi:hypothetical protein
MAGKWLVNDPEARELRVEKLRGLTHSAMLCLAEVLKHLVAAESDAEDRASQAACNHLVEARVLVGSMKRSIDGAVQIMNEQLEANDSKAGTACDSCGFLKPDGQATGAHMVPGTEKVCFGEEPTHPGKSK